MNNIDTLSSLGQSLWLNYLRRAYIESGELGAAIDMGIGGVTSSPAIFERAITCSSDYDKGIQTLVEAGKPVEQIYEALICDDCQRVADRLHPHYELTEGVDGYVSVELNPQVVDNPAATVAQARHVLAMVDRVNVMIEVPATEAGIEAMRILTADGVNVNATHIFSLSTFEKVARAYLGGLEEYLATHSVWRMAPSSVASFSVGRLDERLDPLLAEKGLPELQSRLGIACAKMAYRRFQVLFSGPDWERLARAGGRVMRPKWTRTMPHRFELSEIWYVDALIGADSVMTVRPSTLQHFLRKPEIEPTIEEGMSEAEYHLARAAEAGLDLEVIGRQIQDDSLDAFDAYFKALIASVSEKRNNLELGRQRLVSHLAGFEQSLEPAMARLCDEDVMKRVWAFDTRVSPMLEYPGWLHLADVMEANVDRLERFAERVLADGYRKLLLIGQEPLTTAPAMYAHLFGRSAPPLEGADPYLEMEVLDMADQGAVANYAADRNLADTLFVVAEKPGRASELLSDVMLLLNRLEAQIGSEKALLSLVAVTDPKSDLADLAHKYGFRDCFLNDSTLGLQHVALSFHGLVPAALMGVQLRPLLDAVQRMVCNASSCNCALRGDNHAAHLGVSLISLAKSGRNRLAFTASKAIESFGKWLPDYLLAVTKEHELPFKTAGFWPVADRTEYEGDELFIILALAGDRTAERQEKALLADGQPVIKLLVRDLYDVAGHIFLWQTALVAADYFVHGRPVEVKRKIPAGLVA
jgi:transaldolase / glucose-6-phosphate isomerase